MLRCMIIKQEVESELFIVFAFGMSLDSMMYIVDQGLKVGVYFRWYSMWSNLGNSDLVMSRVWCCMVSALQYIPLDDEVAQRGESNKQSRSNQWQSELNMVNVHSILQDIHHEDLKPRLMARMRQMYWDDPGHRWPSVAWRAMLQVTYRETSGLRFISKET